jgi:hypothetical protein
MGRKSVMPGFAMIDQQSLASNITSSVVSVKNLDYASIHVEWTGTSPVGTLTVEARNGETDSWYELDMGSAISISGNSGDHQLVFNLLPFTDLRLQYAATSGSGTLNAEISMKVTGA